MAAVSHGVRHPLRQLGIGLHGFSVPRPVHNKFLSETRSFFARLVSHFPHSPFTPSAQPSLARPAQLSNYQTINARFSLPVKHALSRPFSPPRLPKPPVVPANVTHVGLGTARAFHSGRPIFQDMVDNVPIATRALWEAEWDVKTKKKEARRMRRATQIKSATKSQEMLKPNPKPIVEPQYVTSELDLYFPVQPASAVTTHLLVPLAPTPTAQLPLSARTDRTDGGSVHPLLPIADLAAIHTNHHLHSLRVSTLFARLDAANVWDDPGVNVDAYAFGPRSNTQVTQEKQCTVLRVTFRGWDAIRVRSILGNSAQEWYSLQETHLDGRPTLDPLPNPRQDIYSRPDSPSLESVEISSSCASGVETDDACHPLSPPPIRASASAHHDLVLPTLDFSSAFSDAVDHLPPPPQPRMFLRTVSELTHDVELASQSSFALTDSKDSWECLGLSSSILNDIGDKVAGDV